MTKRAKKSLLIVLIAAIVFALAVYWIDKIASTTYTAVEISTNLTESSEGAYTDERITDMISKTLKNSLQVKDQTVMDGQTPDIYVTTLSKSGETTVYGLYINSIFKRSAYLKRLSDGRLTKITASDFTEMFSDEVFEEYLNNTQPLDAYLITKETEQVTSVAAHGYPYAGTWNYAGADGKQVSLPLQEAEQDNYYIIKDNDQPFSLYMSDIPNQLMQLSIYENGVITEQLLTDGKGIVNPGRDGYFVYEITATWPTVADVDYNGTVTYRFNIRIDLPATPILSDTAAPHGSVVSVKLENANDGDVISARCESLDWEGTFTKVNGTPTALIGIPLTADIGDHQLIFEVNGQTYTEILTVTEGSFPKQNLTISTTVPQSWIDEQETHLTPLRQYVSTTNYIDGAFIEPAGGKITTYFGTFRYTNGAVVPTRHNGIDIADRTMPDVKAPMDGVVVFTMNMKYTGKTVVVDHGMNVLSYFYHLDSISVKVGDTITQGQKIGRMGTTGYSTGVHLHYTVMVNGVAVDPNIFYQTDFSK